jgi:hypothetical protein
VTLGLVIETASSRKTCFDRYPAGDDSRGIQPAEHDSDPSLLGQVYAFSTTERVGADAPSDCMCSPGRFLLDGQCTRCPAGGICERCVRARRLVVLQSRVIILTTSAQEGGCCTRRHDYANHLPHHHRNNHCPVPRLTTRPSSQLRPHPRDPSAQGGLLADFLQIATAAAVPERQLRWRKLYVLPGGVPGTPLQPLQTGIPVNRLGPVPPMQRISSVAVRGAVDIRVPDDHHRPARVLYVEEAQGHQEAARQGAAV